MRIVLDVNDNYIVYENIEKILVIGDEVWIHGDIKITVDGSIIARTEFAKINKRLISGNSIEL